MGAAGLTANLKRLVLRAFPELGGRHLTRLGIVVAIPDPPDDEQGTDRFRPRYAVDVQLLTPQGEPDEARPVLQGLPLPTHGGLYAFPELGQRVRVGFDYGLPSHPYIVNVIHEGQALPALLPGERLWWHSADSWYRIDSKGNHHRQSDGEIRDDSMVRTIEADATTERHGALTTEVLQDWTQQVGGRLIQEVLGAIKQTCGGDVRVAIVGGVDTTIAGDDVKLVAGKIERVAALDILVKTALGSLLLESVTNAAELKAALGATVNGTLSVDLIGLAVNAGAGATQPVVLGGAFATFFDLHTHNAAGVPTTPPLVLMSVTPGLLSAIVKSA
jgi:dihydroxyacetone kinase DhaKLM complex PTS-EIIA-like component DhaM